MRELRARYVVLSVSQNWVEGWGWKGVTVSHFDGEVPVSCFDEEVNVSCKH